MTKIALSDDINVITAEINLLEHSLDRSINETSWEIGARLVHVKEALQYGKFSEWIENNFKFSRRYAYNFISYFKEYQDVKSTAQLPNFTKEIEIMSLPKPEREEIKSSKHVVPSTGEEKTYNELSQKELREVKKALQEAEQRASKAEATALHNEKLWRQAANQPPRIETKTVEVIPERIKKELQEKEFQITNLRAGYQNAKAKLQEYESRNTVDFDAEQAQKQREKLQHEADYNALELRVHITNFMEKVAITSYLKGALAAADPVTKKRLMESVLMVEEFIDEIKSALNGRILGGVINE